MASVLHDKSVRFEQLDVPKTLDEEPGPTAYEAGSSFHVEQQKEIQRFHEVRLQKLKRLEEMKEKYETAVQAQSPAF